MAVHIWGNELEGGFPLLFYLYFVGSSEFVVEYLYINNMEVLLELGHDAVCCGEAMAIMTLLEWLDQYDVGLYVVGEHDEVVAAAGAGR